MMALLIAMGGMAFYDRLKRAIQPRGATIACLTLGLTLFIIPYYGVLTQNNHFDNIQSYEAEGKILMNVDRYLVPSDTLWVVKPVDHIYHWDQILFYQKSWSKRGGPFIKPIHKLKHIKSGYYLSGDPGFLERIKREKEFAFKVGWQNCELLWVK